MESLTVVTRVYPLDDPSRIGEIRRASANLAHEEALDETLAGNVALVVTEVCTNLIKHAKQGEVFLSKLSDRSKPGIEILAIDRGPGITDIPRCLADGYSSVNTPGTGLGAIARLSQEFDIYSELAKGTVLVARIQAPEPTRCIVGAVVKPIAGEEVCGDAWGFRQKAHETALMLADGLGHGMLAARASAEAVSAFRRGEDFSPTALLSQIHGSLRATRGAAVAVAHVDPLSSKVRYAGIGNISGVLVGEDKATMMISHNGTAGYHSPRLQEFSYPLTKRALIIMHSDGIHGGWNLNDHPGLVRRDPSIIAGVLYREATRNRDDACVVVMKIGAAS